MPSQTSSLRAYGLRANSGRTACSVAAILAAFAASPSLAVAGHAGSPGAAVSAKKHHAEKPGKGIGRGRGGGNAPVPTAPAPQPVPTVAAPTPPPAPTPTQPPAPTPTQEAPKPKPKPVRAAPESPRATPEAPRATPEAPRAAPEAPRAAPEPPRATPQAPTATPDRPQPAAPTPTGEPDNDRAGGGAAPGPGGLPPSAVIPEATPGAPASGPAARRRVQAPRPTGGLVDYVDRSRGGTPVRGGGTTGATGSAPVAYREDSSGRRVYSVPAVEGTGRRSVRVPGGVFGILPSAAIEATAEVAGARAEGRTRTTSDAGAVTPAPTGVTAVLSRPLNVIDEVTGGSIPPLLIVGGLAAIAVALGFGIRRELQRG